MGARKMSLCYFTKETRCQETIILGQFLLHPTRFLSKLDVSTLRVVGEPLPSPLHSVRLSLSLSCGRRVDVSEIRPSPPPPFDFIIEFS